MTWYHGTTADFAKNLVEIGIDLQRGGRKLDFSNGRGFYVQDDLHSAIVWSQKMATSEETIRKQQASRAESFVDQLVSAARRTSNPEMKQRAEQKVRNAEQRAQQLRQQAEMKVFSSVLIFRFKKDDLQQKRWFGQKNFGRENLEKWTRVVRFYR